MEISRLAEPVAISSKSTQYQEVRYLAMCYD